MIIVRGGCDCPMVCCCCLPQITTMGKISLQKMTNTRASIKASISSSSNIIIIISTSSINIRLLKSIIKLLNTIIPKGDLPYQGKLMSQTQR